MNTPKLLLSVALFTFATIASAQESERRFSISPDARGSGPGPASEGRLSRFGDVGSRVLPEYRQPVYDDERYVYDPYFTPQEHRRMVKGFYQKYKSGPSEGMMQRAVRNATRPLRPQDR